MERLLEVIEDSRMEIGCADESLAIKWVKAAYEQGLDTEIALQCANSIMWETLQ